MFLPAQPVVAVATRACQSVVPYENEASRGLCRKVHQDLLAADATGRIELRKQAVRLVDENHLRLPAIQHAGCCAYQRVNTPLERICVGNWMRQNEMAGWDVNLAVNQDIAAVPQNLCQQTFPVVRIDPSGLAGGLQADHRRDWNNPTVLFDRGRR